MQESKDKLSQPGFTYHPKQRFVSEVHVLLYGGQHTEDQADEDHHEP